MRVRSIATLAILMCSACGAGAEKPPMDLPVYPGGTSTMEINMTSEDILPMLKAMMPLAGGKLGAVAEMVSPEEISDILKDLRHIEFAQVDIDKPGVTDSQIADFYARKLPAGRWSRVYFRSENPSGTVALYAQPNTEAVYGFQVTGVRAEGKTIKRVQVAKVEGRIDFARVISLVGKLFVQMAMPNPAPGN